MEKKRNLLDKLINAMNFSLAILSDGLESEGRRLLSERGKQRKREREKEREEGERERGEGVDVNGDGVGDKSLNYYTQRCGIDSFQLTSHKYYLLVVWSSSSPYSSSHFLLPSSSPYQSPPSLTNFIINIYSVQLHPLLKNKVRASSIQLNASSIPFNFPSSVL